MSVTKWAGMIGERDSVTAWHSSVTKTFRVSHNYLLKLVNKYWYVIFHKRLAMDAVDYEKIASLASNAGRNIMIPPRLTCGNNKITCSTAAILDLEISKMATKQ